MAEYDQDRLISLEILVSREEQELFLAIVEKGKFATNRLAFGHMLQLTSRQMKNEEGATTNDGEAENDRDGKKMTADMAVSDIEMKSNGDAGDGVEEQSKQNGKNVKKTPTRKGKAGAGAENAASEFDLAIDEAAVAPKTQPAKKSARGKKTDAASDDGGEALDIPEAETKSTKKSGRGKKKTAAETEKPMMEVDHESGDGDGDGAPKTKKAPAKDDEHQEPAARKGRSKKIATAAAVESVQDTDGQAEPAESGDGKKGGKRKPAAASGTSGATTSDEPEPSTSTKPKRALRPKKNKNYTEDSE